jgi:sterol desaturase/sphingolipid hydroxylase (fatty acid hydroxylase superfamily)
MFKNDFLELASKVHFSVPLYIYVPVIIFFVYKALSAGVGPIPFTVYFLSGLLIWTITEYLLHRFVFHYVPKSKWGLRLHFIFHGVHHDYPRDARRLVMPPSASIPLAVAFYFFFSLFFSNKNYLYALFPGFILGYLIYDIMHYAMHHHQFKSKIMRRVKQHHMLHHYDDSSKGYGVSSALWDILFQSDFPKKKGG